MAGHEKVYVVCENKCFEEGMTKEQILDLTSKASNGIVDPITGQTYKVRVLNKYQYDALVTKDSETIYYVYDEDSVSDIALYASEDTSKGTIEQRLNALGFKQSTFIVSGGSAVNIVTNNIKKQGKYVLANLELDNVAGPIIIVPEKFRPKEDISIVVRVKRSTGYTHAYHTISAATGQISDLGIATIIGVKITNTGWETN